jgi:hypothetical protein
VALIFLRWAAALAFPVFWGLFFFKEKKFINLNIFYDIAFKIPRSARSKW